MVQPVKIGASFLVMKAQTKKKPRQDLPFGGLSAWIPGALTHHQARVEFSLLHGTEEFV